MKMVRIFMAAAVASTLAGGAMAAEVKQVSVSIVSIGGLPADSRTSASVVAFGEPAKEKPEERRRFEVGFVPTIPPAPGGDAEEKARKDVASAGDKAPMEASAEDMKAEDVVVELKGTTDNEKTASIKADEKPAVGGMVTEINTEGMELRVE
ncbi:MAG: hypothetical protein R3D45_04775 [Rhizobiaceae bacterium]